MRLLSYALILLTALSACQENSAPALEPVGPARVEMLRAQCMKAGGVLSSAGAGGSLACQRETRDNGRQCRSGADCEGVCLARSGTCAPVTPLFGCHEVLEAGGRRLTQCLD